MFVSFFVKKSMITHCFVLVICFLFSIGGVASAVAASEAVMKTVAGDEVEELIQEGKLSYKKGNLTDARESLQHALNLIAELSVQSYMGLLPNAPKGWVVEETSADESALFSGIGGLVVATKRYKKEGLATMPVTSILPTMQVALVSDLPAFAQIAVNAMAQLQGVKTGADVIVVAGHKGTVSCNKKSKCEVMIQLGDSAIVTAESQGIKKEEFLALIQQLKIDKFPARQ